MNYTKIYASIVLRAQSERTERLSLKNHGQYFENHHITGSLVSRLFLHHIPLYRTLNANGRKKLLPNKELIDKFE